MTKKFQNKYRIESTRLQNWDYGWNAAYFVTICTKDREHYFGEIENGKMVLSNIGAIADILWYEITNHSKNVTLGEWIIMPNHVHGVIILNGNKSNTVIKNNTKPNGVNDNGNDDGNNNGIDNGIDVDARHALHLHQSQSQPPQQNPEPFKTIGQKRFQNQDKNTRSYIVGSYKSAVSKHAHRLGYKFE